VIVKTWIQGNKVIVLKLGISVDGIGVLTELAKIKGLRMVFIGFNEMKMNKKFQGLRMGISCNVFEKNSRVVDYVQADPEN